MIDFYNHSTRIIRAGDIHNLLNAKDTAVSRKEVVDMTKKTYKVGRDAKTGKFIPVKVAQRRKATAVVETMKKSKK